MKSLLVSALALTTVIAGGANASHNRGSVLIPSIDASGNLTVEATSFWRTSAPDFVRGVRITGPGGLSQNVNMTGNVYDTSDTRFIRSDNTSGAVDLTGSGPGLYTISWSSCCRVSGIDNASASNMGSTSTIFWDGTNATDPISFDIQNIQPNVVRGDAYSDNLDVTSANGDTLSYDDTYLAVSMSSQAPGFAIDGSGQITIPASATATYHENTGNVGADVAFSGEITATDAVTGRSTGSVQFDWLFDAVATGANAVPDVGDVVVNATVGDMINTDITGTDPNGDAVTLSLLSFNGPGGAVSGATFTAGTPGTPVTGNFQWDSTGAAVGAYIATIRGSDGSLSDQGTITVNLSAAAIVPSAVPLPAGFLLLGSAMAGFGLMRRRRKASV